MAGSLKKRLRRRVAALEVRDPDGAVDGRPADRAGALGDDLARAAAQRPLVVDAEEVELACPRSCRGPRGGPRRRGSCGPRCRCTPSCQSIARTSWVISTRARPVTAASSGSAQRCGAAADDPADRLHERLDRGAADLVAIQAALADLARGGSCAWPRHRRRRRRRWPRAPSRPTRACRARSPSPATTVPGRPSGRGARPGSDAVAQIDSGINFFSIGHTISCGRCSLTAASIAAAESTTATVTSWPSSVSAIQAR